MIYDKKEFIKRIVSYVRRTDTVDINNIDVEYGNLLLHQDDQGYVTAVSIELYSDATGCSENMEIKATDVKNIFGLKSDNFSIEYINYGNEINVVTRGIGHGYGMSVCYAQYIANSGYKYDDILRFFYTDILLERK